MVEQLSVTPSSKPLITYVAKESSPAEFVEFWSNFYPYDDGPYDRSISNLNEENILALFKWKNGGPLSLRKQKSVEQHYVQPGCKVPADITAEQYLNEQCVTGGAIWRIFWLHCCRKDEFPIFDQHVYRAMSFIQLGKGEELAGMTDRKKIELYLNQYLPFYKSIVQPNQRNTDRALLMFGQFLKTYGF